MLSSIKPSYPILVCFVALWSLVYGALRIPPLELLPLGSHLPPSSPFVHFYGDNRNIYADFDWGLFFNQAGIDIMGIGLIDEAGELKCMVSIKYFYGRELCWDGKSNSFEETFVERKGE